MQKTSPALVRASVLAALVVVGYYAVSSSSPVAPTLADFSDTSFWSAQIDAHGGSAAYEMIGEYGREHSDIERHAFAHAFGQALYEVEGIDGFEVCDHRHLNGCAHEFIARAIADLGDSAVVQLTETCASITGRDEQRGCLHGIGHGLVAYQGYERSDLDVVLPVCDRIDESFNMVGAEGCLGGLFMEYNLRTIAVGEGGGIRPATESIDSPCASMSNPRHRHSCIMLLPQWWRQSSFSDEAGATDTFQALGERCEAIARNDEELQACFAGIGIVTLPAGGFSNVAAPQLCAAASLDDRSRTYCTVASYLAFLSDFYDMRTNPGTFCAAAELDSGSCERILTTIASGDHSQSNRLADEWGLSPNLFRMYEP